MATLTSTKIKNTYDALLKASDNDAIGSSAKQITDGLGNNTPLYISTTQIGIGVTPEATYDLHVYSNAKVGGNLTVTGDLTVEGTTTTIDTQTLTVEDPLIEVASNNTSTDAVDIGWYGKYAPSGTVLYAGLFRDTGDSKFKLFRNLEEQPTTTVNTSGTGYTRADLVIGNLEATQVDLGDNEKIRFGASQDLEIYHNGSHSYIDNNTGDIIIRNDAVDKGISFLADDGAGGSENYVYIDGGAFETKFYKDTKHLDSVKAFFGTGSDLQIWSTGSTDYISSNNNSLIINSFADNKSVQINTTKAGGSLALIIKAEGSTGEALLYHLGVEKLKTSSTGITVTGDTTTTGSYFADTHFRSSDGNATLSATGGGGIYLRPDGYNQTTSELVVAASGGDTTISGTLTVSGTGQSSFAGQVTVPATPSASTDAASKGYVDSQIGANNELSEVLANGNTTGGTDIEVSSGDNIDFADGSSARFGAGLDLKIQHNGTNSLIDNETGAFYIRQEANDQDLLLQADDGSGGNATYFYLDGSEQLNRFQKNILLPDGVNIALGSSFDLQLYHDGGTESFINNTTGNLIIQNTADDSDIIFKSDDGSGGVTEYFRVDGGANLNVFSKDIFLADNIKALFGSNSDLQIYHDGTNSLILNDTGRLIIRNRADDQDIEFDSDNGSGGTTTYMSLDGSATRVNFFVDTRHSDNVKALFGGGSDLQIYHDATNSIVTNTNGDLRFIQNADDKDIVFYCDQSGSAVPYFQLDGSLELNKFVKNVRLDDNIELQLGTNGDLRLEHTGTNGTITNYTGNLTIEQQADNSDIIFKSDDGAGGVAEYFRLDGSTATFGTYRYTIFPDYSVLAFGSQAFGDLRIFHDGTHSYIYDAGTGRLNVRTSQFRVVNAANSEIIIDATENGSVDLYYDNSKKFETTSTGVQVTGDGVFSGEVTTDKIKGATYTSNSFLDFDDDNGVGGQGNTTTLSSVGPIHFIIDSNNNGTIDKFHFLKGSTSPSSATSLLSIDLDGQLSLGQYGSGSFTGTATYRLAVDSSGDVIEIPIGGGAVDGSGAAGQVAVWSDTDTITGYTRFKVYDSGGQIQVTDGTRDIRINSGYGGSTAMIGTVGSHDLGFMTANSQRVTIDSSGSVGIGTTLPTVQLDIEDSSNVIVDMNTTTANANTTIRFQESGSVKATIGYDGTNDGLILTTGGFTAGNGIFIDDLQNVGIGTTSPVGDLTIGRNGNASGGNIMLGSTTNATNKYAVITSQSYNSSTDTEGFAVIATQGISGTNLVTIGGGISEVDSATQMRFYTSSSTGTRTGTERMRIDSSGNVLITKQSANNATVGNQFMTDGSANSTVNGDTVARFNRLTSDGEIIRLQKDTSTVGSIGSTTSYLNSSLGIGTTSPVNKLHIYENTSAVNSSAGVTIEQDGTGDALLQFLLTATQRWVVGIDNSDSDKFKIGRGDSWATGQDLIIDSSGNVGIGDTTPEATLTVKKGSEGAYFSAGGDTANNRQLVFTSSNGNGSNGAKHQINATSSNGIISLATANVDRLTIGNTGNVGIGTSSPVAKLQVNGSTSDGTASAFIARNSSLTSLFSVRNDGRVDVPSGAIVHSGGGYANTSTNDSYFTGKLGIGTTTPSRTLQVHATTSQGIARFTSGSTTQAFIDIKDANTTADNKVRFGADTDDLVLWANGERFRITSAGNVGIGTTSPSAKLEVRNDVAASTDLDPTSIKLYNNSDGGSAIEFSNGVSGNSKISFGVESTGAGTDDTFLGFSTGQNTGLSERMRINSSGNITMYNNLVVDGDLTAGFLGDPYLFYTSISSQTVVIDSGKLAIGVASSSGSRMHVKAPTGTSTICVIQTGDNANNNVKAIEFRDSTFTDCGEITVNGSTNTTAYGTSSDYRLKEDYKDFNGLDIVSNIPVYDFQWKKSGTRAYGVQAHELQEALPQAVNGEKDGENYQTVDYSKIVPVLLKSIQELKAEIETLKAQINN